MELNKGPLQVEIEGVGARVIDSLYRAGDRYFFLDTDWVFSPTHVYHEIGKLVEDRKEEVIFEDRVSGRLASVTQIRNKAGIDFYEGWKKNLKERWPKLKGIDVIERKRQYFGIPADVKIEQVSI